MLHIDDIYNHQANSELVFHIQDRNIWKPKVAYVIKNEMCPW